ncbi:hypothetical protein NP233_g11969 [Leucocoprinus birnbaumii]|uniref:Uncharacterized protein n=1 Tax=Leucocoprinus birnbaumii TaxID=56174 RepID=A0AAD5YJW1_9AGAR|nr:hypothetical protein NP233_g11969 [Leucocoprinus birnbaumii]
MDSTSTASLPETNKIAIVKEPGLRPKRPERTQQDDPTKEIRGENVPNLQADSNPHQRGHQVPVVGMLPQDRSQSLWMKTSPHRLKRIP